MSRHCTLLGFDYFFSFSGNKYFYILALSLKQPFIWCASSISSSILAFLAPHHLSMPIYFPPCPAPSPSYPVRPPLLSSLPCIPRACSSGRSAGIIVQVYVETQNLSPFLLQFGRQAVYYDGKRIFIHITPA